MDVSDTMRIVLLGKTGCGKSSLGNTILGEELFKKDDSFNSGTTRCQSETKEINGRSVTVIDTPDCFNIDLSEKKMKSEILRCITESTDGPHAFLIVFKVYKFTDQEQAVVDKVYELFSEDALKYTSIVFTHGDQLPEGKEIKDFVEKNKHLSDLVEKCGAPCHVFDNRYWNNNEGNNYRSNKFQVRKLLDSIDQMMRRNGGRCFTNEMLQEMLKKIKSEEERLRRSSPNMTEEEIRRKARYHVFDELEKKFKKPSLKQLAVFASVAAVGAAGAASAAGGGAVAAAIAAALAAGVTVAAAKKYFSTR